MRKTDINVTECTENLFASFNETLYYPSKQSDEVFSIGFMLKNSSFQICTKNGTIVVKGGTFSKKRKVRCLIVAKRLVLES